MKSFKLREFLLIMTGALIIALALNMFIASHNFAFGGVSGLAIIVYSLTKLPLSITNLLVNIPLFFIGAKLKGREFLLKSIFATIAVSVFLQLTGNIPCIPVDNIIAAIFGGIMMGLGVGVVISGGGSTGGTDMVALILNKSFKIPLQSSIVIIDSTVIIIGATLFGINNALYSLILVFGLAKSVSYIVLNLNATIDKILVKIHHLKESAQKSPAYTHTAVQPITYIVTPPENSIINKAT